MEAAMKSEKTAMQNEENLTSRRGSQVRLTGMQRDERRP
jgi:hypothetical protein